MSEIVVPSIDVVIPVYNAPVLTRRCIDSAVSCLSESIEHIHIQDDASNTETREMLDDLPYECVHVYHSQRNQGFGASVNDAVGHSNASYVLVLNSDIEVSENFLPRLCAAMAADAKLAVIAPTSNDSDHYNLNRYLLQPGGYIFTHRLPGYAFLIRRSVFQEVGGFDPAFGRGYYEDIDLGRRIIQRNWRMGVHPDTFIYHEGGGSFGRGLAYRALKRRSRSIYFSRHPNAKRNVLILSGSCQQNNFPLSLLNTIDEVFQRGGVVHWLSPEIATKIPCFHMKNSPANLLIVVKLMMFYGWLRKDKRISDVWLLLPSNSSFLSKLLVLLSKVRGIKITTWKSNLVK
jgi:GT2 family glycosyltransferase